MGAKGVGATETGGKQTCRGKAAVPKANRAPAFMMTVWSLAQTQTNCYKHNRRFGSQAPQFYTQRDSKQVGWAAAVKLVTVVQAPTTCNATLSVLHATPRYKWFRGVATLVGWLWVRGHSGAMLSRPNFGTVRLEVSRELGSTCLCTCCPTRVRNQLNRSNPELAPSMPQVGLGPCTQATKCG